MVALVLVIAAGFSRPCRASIYIQRPDWARYMVKFVDPGYPSHLYRRGVGGSGIFRLTIDQKTGHVTEVKVIKSTGWVILNELVAKACLQWLFRPGTITSLEFPFRFEASGYSRQVH
jgi:TonB family protein